MTRWIGIASLLALAACPKKDAPTSDGTGPGTGTVLVKESIVRFGTHNDAPPQAEIPKTKIWLVMTDETAAAKSYPVDEGIAADCAAEPGGELEALGTLRCVRDGVGANYIAVHRQDDVIVLKQNVAPGEDENDYEELMRITLPIGSKCTFQP